MAAPNVRSTPDLPSTLTAATTRLAGRVRTIRTRQDRAADVELSDALQTCVVRCTSAVVTDVRPGDLVTIRVASDPVVGWIGTAIDHGGRDRRSHRPSEGSFNMAPDARLGEVSRFAASVGTPPRSRAEQLVERARLTRFARSFFESRGSIEVETPTRVTCPGLDVHLDALGLDDGRFLATSPEYEMKRLLVAGFPRVHQWARCFRRGEIGPLHNPEFTMLEWYWAHGSFEALIAETEALIVAVADCARGRAELVGPRRLGERPETPARVIPLSPPFERLPIARAFARHTALTEDQALDLALSGRAEDEARWFRLLVEEVEPELAKGPPVVLVDYPVSQASLARCSPRDPRVCERFEIFVGGVELCNGFGELTDPSEQYARFVADQHARRAIGKPVYPIDEAFIAALAEGMPPSVGNALGWDRLVAMAVGAPTIGDVMAFPTAP